jgi:tetratricopeptide (TPR) repeat protein
MTPIENMPPEVAEVFETQYSAGLERLEPILRFQDRPTGFFGFFARRRARRGIEHMISCLEIVPDSWQCMYNIGKAYQAMDDYVAGLAWFEKAFDLNKENPDIAREASLCCLALGVGETALKFAEAASNLAPENAGLLSNLALALVLNGQVPKAANTAGLAIAKDPDNPICMHVFQYINDIQTGAIPHPDKIGPEG